MNLHLSLYLPAPGKSFFPNTSQMFLFVCLCTYFPKPGLSTLAPPPLWFLAPDDRLTKWDCSGDKWREKHLEFKLIWHFHQKGGRTYICPAVVGSWQEMKDFRMIDLHQPPPIKLRNLSFSEKGHTARTAHTDYAVHTADTADAADAAHTAHAVNSC